MPGIKDSSAGMRNTVHPKQAPSSTLRVCHPVSQLRLVTCTWYSGGDCRGFRGALTRPNRRQISHAGNRNFWQDGRGRVAKNKKTVLTTQGTAAHRTLLAGGLVALFMYTSHCLSRPWNDEHPRRFPSQPQHSSQPLVPPHPFAILPDEDQTPHKVGVV